jgi:hypothetical protein
VIKLQVMGKKKRWLSWNEDEKKQRRSKEEEEEERECGRDDRQVPSFTVGNSSPRLLLRG